MVNVKTGQLTLGGQFDAYKRGQLERNIQPDKGINIEDISCLIIPYGCIGLPTLSALENGIPVIAVKENRNRMENKLEEFPFKHNKLFIVENYLEAVGVIHAIKSGIKLDTVKRPIEYTNILNLKSDDSRVSTTELFFSNSKKKK
jgi:hypothetical protein